MSSLARSIDDELMYFRISEEIERWIPEEGLEPGRRVTRALVKQGPLRMVLIALGPGARIAEHRAEGAIMVQAISGEIRFEVGGEVRDLAAGDFLTLRAGLQHAVGSESGGAFLLVMALEQVPKKES